jgi:hypothetical protein
MGKSSTSYGVGNIQGEEIGCPEDEQPRGGEAWLGAIMTAGDERTHSPGY